MRVLITGANGYVGQAVTTHCVNLGWDVRALDLDADANVDGTDYVQCDVTDYDAVRSAVQGRDAIIHLAAIPTPAQNPGPTVFRVNTTGTFNVFEAAADEGIRRIAQASSINALGCAWGPNEMRVDYFPIDEDHPINPADPYSFSKKVIEDIGAYYWRRDGISSVALRLPWVWTSKPEYAERVRTYRANDRKLLGELAAMPAAERARRIAEAQQQAVEFRQSRYMEYPVKETPVYKMEFYESPLSRLYTFDRFNLWTIVDIRDAAQAFAKGLTAEYEGSHPLFVNAGRNWLIYDTRTLIDIFFPGVTQLNKPLTGPAGLVSIDRARQLIGFEPDHLPTMTYEETAS